MTQHRSKDEAAKSKERHSPELDLSIGQVLAATGATTIGAILVKLLDIWGTILGTATLSVCTSIGAVLLLRTMRRTSEKIREQISALAPNARAGQAQTVDLGDDPTRVTATAAVPAVPCGAETKVLDAAEPVGGGEYIPRSTSRKRTLFAVLVSSVLVFGLTMGALYALGGITGDTARFIDRPAPATTTITEDAGEEADASNEETSSPEASESPSDEASETPSEEPSEADPTEEATTDEPTEEPTDADQGEEASDESPTPEDEAAGTETPTSG